MAATAQQLVPWIGSAAALIFIVPALIRFCIRTYFREKQIHLRNLLKPDDRNNDSE
jgi:hypothetical protein